MTQSIPVSKLTHEHITNLVSIQHVITFDEQDGPTPFIVTTSGQLMSITQGTNRVVVNVGGMQVVVNADNDITIHATHTQMHAPETIEAVKSAFPEEKK